MKKIGSLILKELLLQVVLSGVLVIILAFFVFRFSLGDGAIKFMILAIYGICSLIGGLILGRSMERRKFLWGLIAGAVYIGLIIGISFAVQGNVGNGLISMGVGIAVCLGCGTFGGMIG